MTGIMHTNRVSLHNSCMRIDIDHQAGKIIPFTMNQTICIIVLYFSQIQLLSESVSNAYTFFPEFCVDSDRLER